MHMSTFDPTFRIVALVPAAGIGVRAAGSHADQTPKQYRIITGQPMLKHAVGALLADPRVEQVRVITAPHDDVAQELLSDLPRTVCCAVGGAERSDTVLNGLEQAGLAENDWILVHDAARPGLPREALSRLIDACLENGVGGLLAVPVADTIKFADQTGRVARTVDRAHLWAAQTPQMFRVGLLLAALRQAKRSGQTLTDEAQAMESAGYQPLLIPGSGRNAKVTWPDDFEWVGSWL
jgi:2-C-methyl-D-erythritol 4-phosphate cytidylyltransferase